MWTCSFAAGTPPPGGFAMPFVQGMGAWSRSTDWPLRSGFAPPDCSPQPVSGGLPPTKERTLHECRCPSAPLTDHADPADERTLRCHASVFTTWTSKISMATPTVTPIPIAGVDQALHQSEERYAAPRPLMPGRLPPASPAGQTGRSRSSAAGAGLSSAQQSRVAATATTARSASTPVTWTTRSRETGPAAADP